MTPAAHYLAACLEDLDAALEWLELDGQQRPPREELNRCRRQMESAYRILRLERRLR